MEAVTVGMREVEVWKQLCQRFFHSDVYTASIGRESGIRKAQQDAVQDKNTYWVAETLFEVQTSQPQASFRNGSTTRRTTCERCMM